MPDGLPARKEDIRMPLETPKIEEKTRAPESGEHGGKNVHLFERVLWRDSKHNQGF